MYMYMYVHATMYSVYIEILFLLHWTKRYMYSQLRLQQSHEMKYTVLLYSVH